MLAGMAGLGIVQQNPLDSPFGSIGTNAAAGLGGFGGASLQSANSGNDLLQLAALLGGSQQQNVTFQPAQLLSASTTGAATATSNAGCGAASGDKETN